MCISNRSTKKTKASFKCKPYWMHHGEFRLLRLRQQFACQKTRTAAAVVVVAVADIADARSLRLCARHVQHVAICSKETVIMGAKVSTVKKKRQAHVLEFNRTCNEVANVRGDADTQTATLIALADAAAIAVAIDDNVVCK
jgi:hypothetical protein